MKQERGGTFLGFVIGVVFGLAVALAVAVYITKVPVPFMNKTQTRSADQDVAEAKKNKDWDPNAPLYGKNPAKPPADAKDDAAADAKGVAKPADTKTETKTDVKAEAKADNKTDAKPETKESKPAVSADPLGDLAKAKSGANMPADATGYFVQVGAYRSAEDAESQRAKLSLSGIEAKISEREQAGRMVYRLRVGPFGKKDEAEGAKDKLEKAGLETSLVHVGR